MASNLTGSALRLQASVRCSVLSAEDESQGCPHSRQVFYLLNHTPSPWLQSEQQTSQWGHSAADLGLRHRNLSLGGEQLAALIPTLSLRTGPSCIFLGAVLVILFLVGRTEHIHTPWHWSSMGRSGVLGDRRGKRKPPLWSWVEISGQLRMKNSRTIYIWCKGCTHRDISFTQTYFQIRIFKIAISQD